LGFEGLGGGLVRVRMRMRMRMRMRVKVRVRVGLGLDLGVLLLKAAPFFHHFLEFFVELRKTR
jgi:hypothetical protein